jgi:two-component system alkaline phosphatase synthesis response regulator PhoP
MTDDAVRKTALVVDDEPAIRKLVEFHLGREGFATQSAGDGLTAFELVQQQPEAWDVLILDVMLPGMDGFELCRRLRQAQYQAAILLVTARDEEVDRVLGLELGADDYITKPFSPRELVARVRAVLRRMNDRPSGDSFDESVLRAGDIAVSVTRHEVTVRGEPVELTPKEFDLLVFFLRHPQRVLTRDDILRQVWGYTSAPDTRVVDTYVSHLREKLERNPKAPEHFVTVRGIGYKFVGNATS